ncbi:hypothetical protein [Streptomyces sp. NPDC004528]
MEANRFHREYDAAYIPPPAEQNGLTTRAGIETQTLGPIIEPGRPAGG